MLKADLICNITNLSSATDNAIYEYYRKHPGIRD